MALHPIAGTANLPADFASRNPMECDNHDCQICHFVAESENATIYATTVSDVIDGITPMPFTNRTAWKKMQQDCPILRRVYAHLSQGTRPQKKNTKVKNVKRYLRYVTIGQDGLLVVKQSTPFIPVRELLVVLHPLWHPSRDRHLHDPRGGR